MAESSLSISRAELLRAVGRHRGYGPDPSEWTGSAEYKADEVNDCIKFGLARVYAAHDWRFLRPALELSLNASYATGTIAIASGVVTLTGGSFPSWAADGDLIYGGTYYKVASRGGNTAVTLVDTSVNVSSGASYSLVQSRVSLPDDYAALIGDLHYRPTNTMNSWRIRIIGDETIRMRRQMSQVSDAPRYASIVPRSTTGATGQRFELSLYPMPSSAARLLGRYRINPNALAQNFEYPYGGMLIGPLILAACLAESEQMDEANDGRHELRYRELLEPSKKIDAAATAAQQLGYDLGTNPYGEFPADRMISQTFDPNSLDL